MKLILTTSPWRVPGAIALLENHGFHPRCDPGRVLEEGRVLPGQASGVSIVVPDDEAQAASVLLEQQLVATHPVPRSALALSLVAITFAAIVILAPVPAGPVERVAVTVSVVAVVLVVMFLRRRAAKER